MLVPKAYYDMPSRAVVAGAKLFVKYKDCPDLV